MGNEIDKSLEEALAYMRNLPKIYAEELELNKNIFYGIMAHICDLAMDESTDADAPKYMPLQYEVVQRYCIQGFPTKYVCSYYSRYNRTIKAAILVYYKVLRNSRREYNDEEYEKMFGSFFLEEQTLKKLNERAILNCFNEDERDNIKKEKLAGCLQQKFIDNWKKKRSHLLEQQIEKGQIIRDNLFRVKEFNSLTDEGSTLKRVISFLDKLEDERHKRGSGDDVLIPYEEYHALHEMILKNPWEKTTLKERYMEIVQKLERIFNFEAKKKL